MALVRRVSGVTPVRVDRRGCVEAVRVARKVDRRGCVEAVRVARRVDRRGCVEAVRVVRRVDHRGCAEAARVARKADRRGCAEIVRVVRRVDRRGCVEAITARENRGVAVSGIRRCAMVIMANAHLNAEARVGLPGCGAATTNIGTDPPLSVVVVAGRKWTVKGLARKARERPRCAVDREALSAKAALVIMAPGVASATRIASTMGRTAENAADKPIT